METTSKNQLTVETIKLLNIDGKELLYVRITNNKNEFLNINVGQKTYEGVIKLTLKENEKQSTKK